MEEIIETIYKPKDFARLIGCSVVTLQRWDRGGILKAHRRPTNRRYYTHQQYVEYMRKGRESLGDNVDQGGNPLPG